MSGNEKLKPPVIGKSKKPRCFKNVKSLTVAYEANSNAWMTTTIWERHIRKLDSVFASENYTAHNQPENLKAIEIVFLFAPNERKLEVSVIDAINYVHKSWSSVSSQSVSNCFRQARFIANEESEEILNGDIIDPEPLETLQKSLNEKGCSVNAFVNIDNDVTICSQATVKVLTSEFLEEKPNSSGEDSDVENMDQTPPNKTETIEALAKVRQYLSIQGTTDQEFKALSILEKKGTISSN
ncbi:hypothetical protein AVEN_28418-1 [Araneus ventricosus]|uniref:DDE-1 domain-containing protein n=1 Tax=Araneus ventricosus TaxID=182803 RepID=A0A4Y2QAM5_ARAVE|nr:hypothetical protein AVEN_264241-1 [Araneus ventricosus]GBN59687.1 hypothetical protein AVEN_28418-1 [Araneus ventricosus]